MVEILAPAGDENSALTAIDCGADAIYLGLTAFSARSSAKNFDFAALESIIARAHFFGVKIYVAMNTIVKNDELEQFIKSAIEVHNRGADAIIIGDIFLGAYLKKTYPQLVLHLSTQAGVCNVYGARLAKDYGFSRVILARETPLEDIREIAKIIETEVFVQGALCTCFSGQCYLSSFAGGNSGNRGKCKQPCRKKYSVNRSGFEAPSYAISLADLSVGEDVSKLIDVGVASFKIEGRMRRPEYVAAAVSYYKNLLLNNAQKEDISALKRTYNRGNYTKGLAFGQDKTLISSRVQGHMGEFVGVLFVENGRYICRTKECCSAGDAFKILREGEEVGGGYFSATVKGGFELKSSARLKNGDKVFITTDAALNQRLLSARRTSNIELEFFAAAGKPPVAVLNGARFEAPFVAQEAKGRPITREDIITCFNKTDAYPYEVVYKNVELGDNVFMPLSQLNAFRREVYAAHFRADKKPVQIAFKPLPKIESGGKVNNALCVIAESLIKVTADIGVLKPRDYNADLSALISTFNGQRYLYLPPFMSGAEIEAVKGQISQFDGIYSGGNYAITLARELNKPLFAGAGFNLSNYLSLANCPAKYKVISKELTVAEAKPLAGENTFYLTSGDIKVMDLIYCPFSRSCDKCDKKHAYVLTDENARKFPLRRYRISTCRFELYNCAYLEAENNFTGRLEEHTVDKFLYASHTKGHSVKSVL